MYWTEAPAEGRRVDWLHRELTKCCSALEADLVAVLCLLQHLVQLTLANVGLQEYYGPEHTDSTVSKPLPSQT